MKSRLRAISSSWVGKSALLDELARLSPGALRCHLGDRPAHQAIAEALAGRRRGRVVLLVDGADTLDQGWFRRQLLPGCPPALLARRPKLDLAAELAPAPDIIAALLGCFMREIDDAVERAALEIFAVLRTTTPPLLQSLLGSGDAGRAFAELRRLSFTYSDTTGIYPHDVVREVLLADLRQRQLERLRRLQLAARAPAIVAIWCAASPRWPTSCGARAREISASGCAPR